MAEQPLESRLMRRAEEQFGNACRQLEVGAKLNAAAIDAVLTPYTFDHSDKGGEALYAPQAVAYGYAQLIHALRAVQILCIDYECLSAGSEVLAEG